MKQPKAYILMDLLLGVALLLIIAGAFTRISIIYRHRCRQLAAIRRQVRMEAYTADMALDHHAGATTGLSGLRLTVVPVPSTRRAAPPSGVCWMAVRAAKGSRLPMLYFLRERRHVVDPGSER